MYLIEVLRYSKITALTVLHKIHLSVIPGKYNKTCLIDS